MAIGFVDAVVPDDYVMNEAMRVCREVAAQSQAAVRALKEALRATETMSPAAVRERGARNTSVTRFQRSVRRMIGFVRRRASNLVVAYLRGLDFCRRD
jgi:enoyl-CoA hydratase/carnithine racemase